MTTRETGPNGFKTKFIKRIEYLIPDAIVLLTDPGYVQGIPDLFVLYGPYWAALEVKASNTSSIRPNQEWWINRLGQMSYAAFVYPENEEEVLLGLQQAFGIGRSSRLFGS